MEDNILELLGGKNYAPSNVPELLCELGLPPNNQQRLQKVLKELEREGRIARIKGNRYILPREADLIPGRIQITRSGRGFLMPDEAGLGEIEIPAKSTGTAMHDDHVLVRRDVRPRGRATKKQDLPVTGAVVRVLERRRKQIVGILKRGRQFLYVIPDDARLQHDIYVPPARNVGRPARVGDKVVVEIREWESRHTNPEGEITEVLGPPTAEGVDMLGILRQYDLPLKFPPKVLQEVRGLGTEVSARDCKGRTDCREHAVITIDPVDAKDFDDAFFLRQTSSGHWKLWIHIADVSHYVKPGSALDQEARRRGNSTYLVDRVIPMLPEALSNELCSLRPRVDRVSKCVEFLISNEGAVLRTRFYPAVIHSKQRFSYEEAMDVLSRRPNGAIEKMLHDAGRLAGRIRRRRFKAGSLEMDFPETKIRLDEHGHVRRIERTQNDLSHQLIEEFMLLANEAVAGRLIKLNRPTIHRVHEEPDASRLADYRQEVLSHNVPCGNLEKPVEVRKLLRRLAKLSIGPALKIGFLRSLMRARYAVESLGHYGLAKAKYAHFTSPIRRYADLVVHRSLFEEKKSKLASLKKIAAHISTTERNSADAERDSKNVKLYAYLEKQLKSKSPHRYTALVTDVRNFGVFIDVTDLGLSGLVPMSLLDDDFYEFDPARIQLRGRRTRRLIRLGSQVDVVVAKVDAFRKQVDFRLVPLDLSESKNKGRKKGKGQSSGGSTSERGKKSAKRGRNRRRGGDSQTKGNKAAKKSGTHKAKSGKHRKRRKQS